MTRSRAIPAKSSSLSSLPRRESESAPRRCRRNWERWRWRRWRSFWIREVAEAEEFVDSSGFSCLDALCPIVFPLNSTETTTGRHGDRDCDSEYILLLLEQPVASSSVTKKWKRKLETDNFHKWDGESVPTWSHSMVMYNWLIWNSGPT